MTFTPAQLDRLIAMGPVGPCRVVKLDRSNLPGFNRVWDVYCDDIGDFLATMNPALPVSRQSEAQRICDNANARWAAAQVQS